MSSYLSATMDPWPAFITTVAIIFAVLAIVLFRGKTMSARRRLRGRYYAEDMSPPQGEIIRVSQPTSPSHVIMREQEVMHYVLDSEAKLAVRQLEGADRATLKALRKALLLLTADHWLIAVALNGRAIYLMERGDFVGAHRLLTPALSIISEWPGDPLAERKITNISDNLRRCKKRLGY